MVQITDQPQEMKMKNLHQDWLHFEDNLSSSSSSLMTSISCVHYDAQCHKKMYRLSEQFQSNNSARRMETESEKEKSHGKNWPSRKKKLNCLSLFHFVCVCVCGCKIVFVRIKCKKYFILNMKKIQ